MRVLAKLKYILILPFVGAVLWVLAWGLADVFSHQALRYERQWITTGVVQTQQDWDAAIKWTQFAITLNPLNPNYYELLGRLHFWRFFIPDSPVESFEQAQAIVNTGVEPLKRSIEMRPTWPLAWANLLQLKSIGGQIDYEFEQVWDKSVELGDWEPGVQTILLESGLIHWAIFNEVMRAKTVAMFVSMTSKPFSELRAINVVDRLNAWPLVCDVLVDPILTPDRMRAACAQLAAEQ